MQVRNLKRARHEVTVWTRRPRGAPAPSPYDLECKLEGCPRGYLKIRVGKLLARINANFESRGFMDPLISYLAPQAWFFENWQQGVYSDYFYLTFAHPDHSLAFYTYWDQYHWESQEEGWRRTSL